MVTLAADILIEQRGGIARTAAWYDKTSPSFADAIALVSDTSGCAGNFYAVRARARIDKSPAPRKDARHASLCRIVQSRVADPDIQELPVALYHRLVDSLAYAA